MTPARRRWLVPCVTLWLAACGSSPHTHFYTLDPVPPGQITGAAAGHGATILVGNVDLPSALDRLSLVTRIGAERLSVSDQDRWAAPLDELVQRALTQDLRERLPNGTVLAAGDPAPPNARTLSLNVQRFIADDSGRITLDTDWILQAHGHPGTTRHEQIHVTAASRDGSAIAAAMSEAVGELADRVAAAS